MKKILIGIFILFHLSMCTQPSSFDIPECNEKDTYYMVFKPCRKLIFNAMIWDADYSLISEGRILMMATGNPWEHQPDLQRELVIQYEYDDDLISTIVEKSINKEFVSRPWQKQEVTGIIEDGDRIWMHPFRSNQYAFTEVAPFPEIRLPLEKGMAWNGGTLNIYDGWGEWSNASLTKYYEVVDYEKVELPFDTLNAWHISSQSVASFGNSTHNFWFHDKLGFVKMVINNYAGQTLLIELAEVIDD